MSKENEKIEDLQNRIKFLEQRVRALRFSRRVLMDLLAIKEQQRKVEHGSLSRQNKRLRQRNTRYAKTILKMQTVTNFDYKLHFKKERGSQA